MVVPGTVEERQGRAYLGAGTEDLQGLAGKLVLVAEGIPDCSGIQVEVEEVAVDLFLPSLVLVYKLGRFVCY